MKKFLYLFAFLIITFNVTPSHTSKINNTYVDKELYKMLQSAYIKENILAYELRLLIRKTKNYTNIINLLNKHRQNINILHHLITKYSLAIPAVQIPQQSLKIDLETRCREIIKIKKELIDFYNESLRLLSTFQKNESIGIITEEFERLKNNIDIEEYYTLCKDL